MDQELGWKYEVIRKVSDSEVDTFGIHEVWFIPDGPMLGYTVHPIFPPSPSLQALIEYLDGLLSSSNRAPIPAGGSLEDVRKWRTAADRIILEYADLPDGEPMLSSPSGDLDDPLNMEVIRIGSW